MILFRAFSLHWHLEMCVYAHGRFSLTKEFGMSELLTVSEVARILRVDDTTVRRWVKQGTLEAVVLPHVNARQAYRIKRETLDRLLGQVSSLS
jgi:excisionase family DNA binding protein